MESGTIARIANTGTRESAVAAKAKWAVIRARALALLEKFDPDEPRDDEGKWTDGGGGSDGGKEHPGPGYSAGAYIKDGVIHTNNVYDAQRALFENKKVELKQAKQVSTLIKRLGEVAKKMAEQGKEAPVFNLCNVTVAGTNLFCADTKGIPRVKMPVIPAKQTKDFIKFLKKQGYKVEKGKEYAANLRATQSEISGAKVAASMKRIEEEGFYKRLVISRDDYILDGHHTWAGQLGVDAKNNDLHDERSVKVARVDISITKLIAAAEKFTGGAGKKPASEAPPKSAAFILAALVREFDPSEPRDDEGKWTSGGGSDGGTDKPSSGGKKQTDFADFAKDQITIDSDTRTDPEKQQKFVNTWNSHIGEAPAEFRKDFLGGLNGTMALTFEQLDEPDKLTMQGNLLGERGQTIGNYTRTIDFGKNKAESDYFKLNAGQQHADVGKTMLAANMKMYQKLGLDEVKVHANIDVGGYAWAKYGYVPTRASWSVLSSEIEENIDKMAGVSGGYEASSWDEVSEHDQNRIERAWRDSTQSEFYDSEVDNWREGGQPLEEAKTKLAEDFDTDYDWADHALSGYEKSREDKGQAPLPFTHDQILNALTLDYDSRHGDGRGDVTVDFDNDELKEPTGYDPAQPTLPGIEAIEPHEYLNEAMRDGISRAIEKAFDREAESKASDADPPDYINESVAEMQGEYWDSMEDDQKFDFAKRNGELPESTESEGTGELDEADAERLRTLTASSDPKAIWLIADSQWGKDLLLGTDWSGVINLHDKETMDRFNAYVGKTKTATRTFFLA